MPQDRGQRRKHSRSLSPVPSKQKRSWQNDGSSSAGGDGRRSQRPRSPLKRDKKHFKSPPKFHDHKDYRPPMGGGYKGRSSPHSHKRSRPLSPFSGPSQGSSFPRAAQSPPHARDPGRKEHRPSSQKERSESRLPRRSASPRPPAKVATDRAKHEDLFPKSAPLSSMGNSGDKKKTPSSPPPKRNRSLTPPVAAPPKRAETVAQQKISTERKVSSSGKKKTSRVTLHKRFTLEDQQPFELEENVTIAILRNPNAEPSEDVTVKKVFDPSLFKMVHKKNEGRKPIFDREEIKVWRHDENFTDDPDFERRLVRVKSTSSTSKPNTDSLSRMSPDVIRKAFGLQLGGRSGSKSPLRSRSPHREPQIR